MLRVANYVAYNRCFYKRLLCKRPQSEVFIEVSVGHSLGFCFCLCKACGRNCFHSVTDSGGPGAHGTFVCSPRQVRNVPRGSSRHLGSEPRTGRQVAASRSPSELVGGSCNRRHLWVGGWVGGGAVGGGGEWGGGGGAGGGGGSALMLIIHLQTRYLDNN